MNYRMAVAITATILCPLTASAQSNLPIAPPPAGDVSHQPEMILHGEYLLESVVKKNGIPICREKWVFGEEKNLTIYGDKETKEEKYEITFDYGPNKNGYFTWKYPNNFGDPDCHGRNKSFTKEDEFKTKFFVSKVGNLVLYIPNYFNDGHQMQEIYQIYATVTSKGH